VKVAGVEGSFEKFLQIAKFEETKLRDIVYLISGAKKPVDFLKNLNQPTKDTRNFQSSTSN